MIRITVSGDTYDIRKRLKDNGFRWDPESITWHKTVGEASLDCDLDAIRPPQSFSIQESPQIYVILQSVDVRGNELNNSPFKLKLKELARPGVSVLDEFSKETVSDIHESPVQAPGPSNPEKKPRRIDDGFY